MVYRDAVELVVVGRALAAPRSDRAERREEDDQVAGIIGSGSSTSSRGEPGPRPVSLVLMWDRGGSTTTESRIRAAKRG
jgi:hypothetical protein